jgi:hypothetical protein
MKKIRYILYILLLVPIIIYSAFNINGQWDVLVWTPLVNTSNSIDINNISYYDRYSDEYTNQDLRVYSDYVVVDTETYWIFSSSWSIKLRKQLSVNSWCESEDNISYLFYDWEFQNNDWWEGYIIDSFNITNNYFCPNSWKFSLPLKSSNPDDFFEPLVLSNNWVNYNELTVIDSSWNTVTLDERILFSNAKLSIWWIINNNVWDLDEFDWWNESQQNLWYINSIWDYNFNISDIKRSVHQSYNTLDWIDNVYGINSLSSNIMLYDYEWNPASIPSNVDNAGRILEVSSAWWLTVNWVKTLIVRWWNIYIKDNISNSDKDSLLTIIVLRDENEFRNGWNIYVDPSVTNIDAVLIWEWSLLSYNWVTVLNSENSSQINQLRKQLFIYWSVISKNTIWKNVSVYATDDYISNWWENNTPKYNLENLRSFQVVRSEQIVMWTCNDPWKITAIWNDETTSLEYAFAWWKYCYFDENPSSWLRSTSRIASTVIEYNPNLQILKPSVLQIK